MNQDFTAETAAIGHMDAVPMILDIVCRTTGMGFAAVAHVTEDRWIACSVLDRIQFGLAAGGELKVETTICHRIRETGEAVLIDDTETHPFYRHHPTPSLYGFRSYVSMPIIRADGSFFGTLCAIDPHARKINTPEIRSMFKAFAALIASHLAQSREIEANQQALAAERSNAGLREISIAVLGHDLRNPIAAIEAGTRLLRQQPLNDRGAYILGLMEGSVRRMNGLVDSVLDFARGRMGGGIPLTSQAQEPLAPMLNQVVAELRAANPHRPIEVAFDLPDPVSCDRTRIGQLFSNLLANAITHGAPAGTIRVRASAHGGAFELEVANPGEPIPESMLQELFQPFHSNTLKPSQHGLGLGLYIADMIAAAHGGTLTAASSAAETRFTFRMPPPDAQAEAPAT
jgi:signal transduction histidine kinase